MFGLTDTGFLVDAEDLKVFSPSAGKFVRPSFSVAEIMDSTVISDDKAKELMEDPSSLNDPLKADPPPRKK